MTYVIPDGPLSRENRAFLLERSQLDKINAYDAKWPPTEPVVEDTANRIPADLDDPTGEYDMSEFDHDTVAVVKEYKVEELKANLKEFGVTPIGNKAQLVWKLLKANDLAQESDSGD